MVAASSPLALIDCMHLKVYTRKEKKKRNERAKRNKEHGIRLGRQVAVIGLADLERSAQREKQGEKSVWNGYEITEQEKGRERER
jgi:hypothetical protein